MKRNIISWEFETAFQSTCVFDLNFILTYIRKRPSEMCYRRHNQSTSNAKVDLSSYDKTCWSNSWCRGVRIVQKSHPNPNLGRVLIRIHPQVESLKGGRIRGMFDLRFEFQIFGVSFRFVECNRWFNLNQ